MLYNTGDIINEVLVKMNQSTTQAFFTDAILNTWVSKAHTWAAQYKKWPFTEGRNSTTFASLYTNEDGYLTGVYPEGYKPDSIRRLTIGGKTINKKELYTFLKFLEDNVNNTDKIYSNFGNLYFINPNSGVSGTITAWGQYIPGKLDATDPTAVTVFSGASDEGNQAIAEEVMSYAEERIGSPAVMIRGKVVSASLVHHQNAEEILERIWKNYEDEAMSYQSADNDGMWKRIDIVSGLPTDNLFHRDRFP